MSNALLKDFNLYHQIKQISLGGFFLYLEQ